MKRLDPLHSFPVWFRCTAFGAALGSNILAVALISWSASGSLWVYVACGLIDLRILQLMMTGRLSSTTMTLVSVACKLYLDARGKRER